MSGDRGGAEYGKSGSRRRSFAGRHLSRPEQRLYHRGQGHASTHGWVNCAFANDKWFVALHRRWRQPVPANMHIILLTPASTGITFNSPRLDEVSGRNAHPLSLDVTTV
jgi:hypothetical protein